MLFNEFDRAGIYWDYKQFAMVDVGNIYKIQEPRTLAAGVKFYLGKELEGAHGAEADILATCDVFLAQLERYDLPTDLKELALFSNHGKPIIDLAGKFTTNPEGEIILTFGKYKGERAKYHTDFLGWMLRADFPADTNAICEQLLQEVTNEWYETNSKRDDGLPF